jgi:D-alanine-D-alanine ligase
MSLSASPDLPITSGLEVNTQPGVAESSRVPEIAAHAGISFAELVAWMVEDASLAR